MKLKELLKVTDYRIPICLFVVGTGLICNGEEFDSSSSEFIPYYEYEVIDIQFEESYPYYHLLITVNKV